MYRRPVLGMTLVLASVACASGGGGVQGVYRESGECLGQELFVVRNLTTVKVAVTEASMETRASKVVGIVGRGVHEFPAREGLNYYVRRADDGGSVNNLMGHGRQPVTTERVCRPT